MSELERLRAENRLLSEALQDKATSKRARRLDGWCKSEHHWHGRECRQLKTLERWATTAILGLVVVALSGTIGIGLFTSEWAFAVSVLFMILMGSFFLPLMLAGDVHRLGDPGCDAEARR